MFGLEVKIINTQEGTSAERRFERFPVRIGRNALNDLQLESAYVSQFHAIIDLVGDKPHLVDLGSRNGTLLPGVGRVQPQTSIDLTAHGNEFAITPTIFRISVIDVEPMAHSRRRGGVHDIAEELTRPMGTYVGAVMVTQLKPFYDEWRQSWARLYQQIQNSIGTYEPETRAKLCEELMLAHPNLITEPDFKRLASTGPPSGSIPIDVENSASFDAPREEAVALNGIKQLASWYLPNAPPPHGVEDVLKFLQTIQDTLDVFMKCYVPLRDAYKQFEAQMDIPRARGGRYQLPSPVETARDPRELAHALLDYHRTTGDEPRIVENTFAELMTHQVALLNGVMKGVKSLLNELSPEEIERSLDDPHKNRNRQGLQIGPFRFKQLWELYSERHMDLAVEDKQTFAVIFGPQFAQAYSQFVEGAAPGHTTEVRVIDVRNANNTQPSPPIWPPRR